MHIPRHFNPLLGWHIAHDLGGKRRGKSQKQIVRQSIRVTNSEEPTGALDPGRSVVYLAQQRPEAQPNAQSALTPGYPYNPAAHSGSTRPYRLG